MSRTVFHRDCSSTHCRHHSACLIYQAALWSNFCQHSNEWCRAPVGWALNRHRWRQELADTHTYARLYLLAKELRLLTKPARVVCRHHIMPLLSPQWRTLVPRVGEQCHYVPPLHTVANCREVHNPENLSFNSPFHSIKCVCLRIYESECIISESVHIPFQMSYPLDFTI